MFEIGWSEMLLCAIVALVVVGPKDLPHMMRGFGRWMAQLRNLASQFQRAMEDAAREMDNEDLREARKNFTDLRSIRNPFDAAVRGVSDALNRAGEAKPSATKSGEAKPGAAPSPATPSPSSASVAAPPPVAPSPAPASASAEAPASGDSSSGR